MINATFYCDIFTEDGDLIESEFDFDSFTCDTQEELDNYIKRNAYVKDECCGYWGSDYGIYRYASIVHDYIV